MEAARGVVCEFVLSQYCPLLHKLPGTTREAVLTEFVLRFKPTFLPVFVSLIKLPLAFGTDDNYCLWKFVN